MQTLTAYLENETTITMQSIGNYIQQYIDAAWQQVLDENLHDLQVLYDRLGEGAAYGTYAQRLLVPVQDQLKKAGFQSTPPFPGTLNTSREWGPEEQRERWMWSVLSTDTGEPLGTLVIIYFHDHGRFRIPKPPVLLTLEEVETEGIIAALARQSRHFEDAAD